MTAIGLWLVACWISAAFGRVLLDRLVFRQSGQKVERPAELPMGALERFAYAAALGLGIAAYGVYALGLCGLLSFWPVTIWWALLAVLGLPGMRALAKESSQWVLQQRKSLAAPPMLRDKAGSSQTLSNSSEHSEHSAADSVKGQDPPTVRWIINAAAALLLICGAIATLACFRPPGPIEWDVLSYHLADPKLFLMQHRIVSLPTEHHSNFPFLMEMLFTAGLLYNGYALANLFHVTMTALTVLAMIGFCSRMLRPVVGWLAAVVFVTTPLVLWEASVAYIDLGLACYTTLAAFAAVSALEDGRRKTEDGRRKMEDGRWKTEDGSSGVGRRRSREESEEQDSSLPSTVYRLPSSSLILAGAMMGFALGMKYLALIPFALLGVLLLAGRVSVKKTVVYAAVALIVGSPWYLKNSVVVNNPVYPFVYRVFPHSAYWSADRANAYQSEQDKFGTKVASTDVRGKLLNLLQAPWHLLARPNTYCNPGEFNFTALIGGAYAALLFPLAFLRRIPLVARSLLWLAAGQLVCWFLLSQVSRYLIQIMPLLAVVGAYGACRFVWGSAGRERERNDPGDSSVQTRDSRKSGGWRRLPGLLGLACVFGQAGYALLSVCTLPRTASYRERLALQQLGQMPSSISVPESVANLTHAEAWKQDLNRYFDAYSAMEWINQNTPKEAGVALYEETRGFYLDRPYLWANQQHSAYIPYETLRDGAELTSWLHARGIAYALVNLNQASQNNRADKNGAAVRDADFPDGPNGNETAALQKWYAAPASRTEQGDRGHQLLGDAVRRGLWTPVFANHGCIVLQMSAEPKEVGTSEQKTSEQNKRETQTGETKSGESKLGKSKMSAADKKAVTKTVAKGARL